MQQGYLDVLFTEMATIVLKAFRRLPGALSSFQVIIVVISVFDAVLHPQAISASCRKPEGALQ